MVARIVASPVHSLALIFVGLAALAAQAAAGQPSAEFDGKWSVKLVCDDVRDKGPVVKGYTYYFDVDVKNGQLQGQYGHIGQAASVQYSGVIQPDGSVDITANGRTGKPERSVGAVDSGTPYGYQMRGQFDKTFGHATRTTLRPCEATFSKN